MLPNFLIIGAMKAGTSSLWEYLRHHPEIFVAPTKEPDFFTAEGQWSLGVQWCEQQFAGAGRAVAIGEASTSYTKHPRHTGVPRRIASLIPTVRMIYLVRDPIDRMRSEYYHRLSLGHEQRSMERALGEDSSYLDFSRYMMQIEQYLECFPRQQMLVVTSESLRFDRPRVMGEILRFLGVDATWDHPIMNVEFHRTVERRHIRPWVQVVRRLPGYHAAKSLVPAGLKKATYTVTTHLVEPSDQELSPGLRKEIVERLADDLTRLRMHVGGDFDCWGLLSRESS